LSFLGSALD